MDQQQKWNSFYSSQKREPFLHFTEEQLDNILEKFPQTKTALDIGCGEGQLLVQLSKREIIATGIDISDIGINEAKKHFNGTLILDDFEEYEFPQGKTFDSIFVKFVIAFIKHPENFFKKINSLLNTGGGFILLTPAMPNPDHTSTEEEVFVDRSLLETLLPQYFSLLKKEILYTDHDKQLLLLICRKK